MTTLRLRPIDRWPREQTIHRHPSRIAPVTDGAGPRSPTARRCSCSNRELGLLGVDEVVVQLAGRIYGPYVKVEGRKPRYDWATGGQVHCRALVAAFWPYLGARRRQRAQDLGLTPLDLRYDDDVA